MYNKNEGILVSEQYVVVEVLNGFFAIKLE